MAEQRTGSCVVCQQRDFDPQLEPQAPVCGPCRSRLRGQLSEIPGLCAVAAAGPRPELEAGPAQLIRLVAVDVLDDGQVLATVREYHARHVRIAAGAIPGPPAGPRVASNTGEAPIPIQVDRLDLLGEADERTVHDRSPAVPMVRATGDKRWVTALFGGKEVHQLVHPREVVRQEKTFRCRCGRPELHADQPARPVLVPDSDQVGHVSVATVLHGWCRDIAETRRETEPAAVPASQCRYLLDRVDWLLTDHPAVDELAAEISDVWHALRSMAGLSHPQPELCVGVPCKSLDCDLKTLWRVPGSDYVECSSCSRLYSSTEYADWVKLVAAAAKRSGKTVVPAR